MSKHWRKVKSQDRKQINTRTEAIALPDSIMWLETINPILKGWHQLSNTTMYSSVPIDKIQLSIICWQIQQNNNALRVYITTMDSTLHCFLNTRSHRLNVTILTDKIWFRKRLTSLTAWLRTQTVHSISRHLFLNKTRYSSCIVNN